MAESKRRPNWTEEERILLIDNVNKIQDRLFGKFKGCGVLKGGKIKEQAWEEVVKALNACTSTFDDLQMVIMDYSDANFRLVKKIQLLSNLKLIILVLVLLTSYTELADSSDQMMNVTSSLAGDNACFTWDYEVPPFFAIEWYFENTQIAETSEPSFSLDVLHINKKYIRRFVLQSPGNVGFNITRVTKNDEGDYRCVVTLKNTDIPKALKKKLQVKDQPVTNGSTTTTNSSDDSSAENINKDTVTTTVAFPVIAVITVIAVISIITFCVIRLKKLSPKSGQATCGTSNHAEKDAFL